MRYLLPLLLLLASCAAPNIQPALTNLTMIRESFLLEQANTRSLVASARPPADVMAAFDSAQAVTRTNFEVLYRTQVSYLGSLGQLEPEQVELLLQKLTDVIVEVRK